MTATGTGRPMPSVAHSQSASNYAGNLVDLLGLDPDGTTWRDSALCAQVDNDLFYPEKGGSTRPAKSLCERCEVRQQCLDFAVANDERHGIWGGLSERERRRLRAAKKAPTSPPEPQRRDLKPIDHGTPRGYVTHRRRKEESCRPCLDAFNAYNKNRLAVRAAAAQAETAPAPEPVVEPTPLVQPTRRAARPWTTAEARDAVRQLTAHGMTATEIADQLGLSKRTVHRVRTQGRAA